MSRCLRDFPGVVFGQALEDAHAAAVSIHLHQVAVRMIRWAKARWSPPEDVFARDDAAVRENPALSMTTPAAVMK